MSKLLLVALSAALALTTAHAFRFSVMPSAEHRRGITVHRDGEPGVAVRGSPIAYGEFNETMNETGWNTLSITSNGNYTDAEQAYAVGYAEGSVTSTLAYLHFSNHYSPGSGNDVTPNIIAFWEVQMAWLRQQSALNNASDPYWFQVGLMLAQFDGLLDGINDYALSPAQTFNETSLLQLVAMGDLFDLQAALNPQSIQRADWRSMKKRDYDQWFGKITHCSSLFKVLPDMSDVIFGHTAWYDFTTMNRVFKKFELNYNSGVAARTVRMSSYPGMLSSFDDFYLAQESGMAVIETSISVFNMSMYAAVVPQLVPYWIRIMVGVRNAATAPQFAQIFSRFNSGTYNNEWLALQVSAFVPFQPLAENLMWVLDQLPGQIVARDVTSMLRLGYIPSFNVPIHNASYVAAGYPEAVATQGPQMNAWDTNVRGEIFRRDQAGVVDMPTFQHLLRYNDFENDPISAGNPLYAIASRVDLDPEQPQCFGALDAKASSYSLWRAGGAVLAQSGPTQQQPVFQFSTTTAQCGPHAGLPNTWDFPWQTMDF